MGAMNHDMSHGEAASSLQRVNAPMGSLAATILDASSFSDPIAREAYAKAAEVPDRLNKLYCYCHCHETQNLKHESLLSCYQGEHAAECEICQKEALLAWSDAKKGGDIESTRKAIDLMYGAGEPARHPNS